MNSGTRHMCAQCRIVSRSQRWQRHAQPRDFMRLRSSSNSPPKPPQSFESALAQPSWSVRSLLPSSTQPADASSITSKQLHHLLRLSALPAPSTPAEEAKMLDTLRSQLHFVKDVQSVDTAGVEPLRSIRDGTAAAAAEEQIGLEDMRHVLDKEEVVGPTKRIRRRSREVTGQEQTGADTKSAEDWDVLGQASRKVGKYFVVETEKEKD